jgi:hypothetical protein
MSSHYCKVLKHRIQKTVDLLIFIVGTENMVRDLELEMKP